jgi:Uma2 family endonuclease
MSTRTPLARAGLYPSLPSDQLWPEQGHWTYEDYLRLPDEGTRHEIIDGVLHRTNAPDPEHQYAVIEGSPDLIVEVTSPSTARADRKVKLDAYERAGVCEYWIANPRTRFVEVYVLVRGEYALLGEYGPGYRIASKVLPGLELAPDTVFPAGQ